jgi:acetolactate synthase-1/2/3 large subunit
MNGAESLVRTLVAGGIDVTFANPGTSEMHYVAALDRVDGMRCVLCLSETVVTGAADGYGRMADKPASTLLHLGPGLANGLANLHNARRAKTPIVNIVGEHTTDHREHDAPLHSDIMVLAGTVSVWVHSSEESCDVAAAGAEAIAAARRAPGGSATLILPADTAWGEGGGVAPVPAITSLPRVDEGVIAAAADALARDPAGTMLLLGFGATRQTNAALAAAIAHRCSARVLFQGSSPRVERGAGRVHVDRLPYPVDLAVERLKDVRTLVLIGGKAPVAFFKYPGKPSLIAPPDCTILTLADAGDDIPDALARLAARVGAREADAPRETPALPGLPSGPVDPDKAAIILAALLPEQAVVCDESITTGRSFWAATRACAPHDWLTLTGGAIGLGIPLATGAAIAAPGRKVVNLQADGSGLYSLQGLWTQAREKLDVVTVIWANRSYAILRGELANVGATNPGRKALDMLSLDDPAISWVDLARGFGVDGARVDTCESFADVLRSALARPGPFLIEVLI